MNFHCQHASFRWMLQSCYGPSLHATIEDFSFWRRIKASSWAAKLGRYYDVERFVDLYCGYILVIETLLWRWFFKILFKICSFGNKTFPICQISYLTLLDIFLPAPLLCNLSLRGITKCYIIAAEIWHESRYRLQGYILAELQRCIVFNALN